MNASKFGYHSDQGALVAFSGGQIYQLCFILFKKENSFKPYNLYQLLKTTSQTHHRKNILIELSIYIVSTPSSHNLSFIHSNHVSVPTTSHKLFFLELSVTPALTIQWLLLGPQLIWCHRACDPTDHSFPFERLTSHVKLTRPVRTLLIYSPPQAPNQPTKQAKPATSLPLISGNVPRNLSQKKTQKQKQKLRFILESSFPFPT